MARENFTNFATSLTTGSMTSGSTSFSVTSGQGQFFPSANFVVTIDTEVILILSRSTDTFTIASGGRGYDGSTAASHSSGATVQCAITSYNLNHIWQNIADSYHPEVPPVQSKISSAGVLNGSASAYDNEFESAGSWTLYPSPGGSTTFNAGTSLRSHLLFCRGGSDGTLYTAYTAFSPGTSFTITAKLSDAINESNASGNNFQVRFFVSDQSNPTAGSEVGNMFKISSFLRPDATGGVMNSNYRIIAGARDISGTFASVGNQMPLLAPTPFYFRISYDGSGNWLGYVGDGSVYWILCSYSGTFTPQSMGFHFLSNSISSSTPVHTVAIDFVRATIGSILPPYGN